MLSQAKFHYLWGLGGKLSELSGEIPEQLENTITLNFNSHHFGKKFLYLLVVLISKTK